MKRLTLLAVALVMILGMAASAAAAPEVSVSGNLLVNAVWQRNWKFKDSTTKSNNSETFTVYERADLYFTATASENLKGVLGFRSLKGQWGKGGFANGNPGGTSAATIGIRDAYVDFNWPGTSVNVKAGVQPIGLPAAIGGGSFIQNDRAGAVMVSTSFTDNVGLLAGWARLNDGYAASNSTQSEIDGWLLALPLTFEGFNMTPYALYAPLGENVNGTAGLSAINGTDSYKVSTAYWLGTDFTMSLFDPFIVKADLAYGKANGKDNGKDRSGWLFDAALQYTGFDFMTPELFFVYTSGEDGNSTEGNGDSERMPILAGDWAVGSFFFGGGLITGDDLDSNTDQIGFWALGLSLTGIQSFAEGLTHDAHIMYVQGTNDKNTISAADYTNSMTYGRSLTEKESLWEVDFNTMYKIYDELTLYTGLGYINLDADTNVRGANNKGGDAYKVTTGVVYKF